MNSRQHFFVCFSLLVKILVFFVFQYAIDTETTFTQQQVQQWLFNPTSRSSQNIQYVSWYRVVARFPHNVCNMWSSDFHFAPCRQF